VWFKGGVFVADQHFSKGTKLFRDPLFLTALKSPASLVQQKFNRDLYRLRSRIEHPFAWFDTKFESLSHPWHEPKDQMDYAVAFATGLYNVLHRA